MLDSRVGLKAATSWYSTKASFSSSALHSRYTRERKDGRGDKREGEKVRRGEEETY
jgi:hypothetical protein